MFLVYVGLLNFIAGDAIALQLTTRAGASANYLQSPCRSRDGL